MEPAQRILYIACDGHLGLVSPDCVPTVNGDLFNEDTSLDIKSYDKVIFIDVLGAPSDRNIPLDTVHEYFDCQSDNTWVKMPNREESKYHDLLRNLMDAPIRPNRTGIYARGLFHEVLKFKLMRNNKRVLPLLTTKRMPWKTILHELIWFLQGSTDTTYLHNNKVTIWDDNSSREYLDSVGLHNLNVGELGPIYGYQWRYANGIDQLANVIATLIKNPMDRRMIVDSWNVAQLKLMALPPCHYSFQFHVDLDDNGKPCYLNCLVNMRSADMFLGVPFNIASYAFLTHIVSRVVGLTPGILSLSMADCHLYSNHMEQTTLMLTRSPQLFPTIEFAERTTGFTIDDFAHKFSPNDITIADYNPHPAISATMAV